MLVLVGSQCFNCDRESPSDRTAKHESVVSIRPVARSSDRGVRKREGLLMTYTLANPEAFREQWYFTADFTSIQDGHHGMAFCQ